MIVTVDADKVELDARTLSYVQKKIGDLERFLPKQDRKDAQASVMLRRIDQPHGNKYEAEVEMQINTRQIVAKDTTLNVLAAVDIVRAKLLGQLRL